MPFGSVTKANKFSGVGLEAKFLQLVGPGSLKFSVENRFQFVSCWHKLP